MKKNLILILLLMGTLSAFAQTFNYTGIDVKSERVKKKYVFEWENFILANYYYGVGGDNGLGQHSIGVTYGRVKLFGFYASMLVGTGSHYGYSYRGDISRHTIDDIYPSYTGKISQNHVAFTVGGIVRLVIPLYFYIGTGYGYKTTTMELADGNWMLDRYHRSECVEHGHQWELGLQGNIKGFTISTGLSALVNYKRGHLYGVKIGIGYTFK